MSLHLGHLPWSSKDWQPTGTKLPHPPVSEVWDRPWGLLGMPSRWDTLLTPLQIYWESGSEVGRARTPPIKQTHPEVLGGLTCVWKQVCWKEVTVVAFVMIISSQLSSTKDQAGPSCIYSKNFTTEPPAHLLFHQTLKHRGFPNRCLRLCVFFTHIALTASASFEYSLSPLAGLMYSERKEVQQNSAHFP